MTVVSVIAGPASSFVQEDTPFKLLLHSYFHYLVNKFIILWKHPFPLSSFLLQGSFFICYLLYSLDLFQERKRWRKMGNAPCARRTVMGFISRMTNCINFVLTPATPTNTLFKVLLNQHKQALKGWKFKHGRMYRRRMLAGTTIRQRVAYRTEWGVVHSSERWIRPIRWTYSSLDLTPVSPCPTLTRLQHTRWI